jgi:23S rRNA pseudouridine1911/1915/1917 synthase
MERDASGRLCKTKNPLLTPPISPAYTHNMEKPNITIIHQDHHMLIVNKPAGMVIHPTYVVE